MMVAPAAQLVLKFEKSWVQISSLYFKITNYHMLCICGYDSFSLGLVHMEKVPFSIENNYKKPNYDLEINYCKTNYISNVRFVIIIVFFILTGSFNAMFSFGLG